MREGIWDGKNTPISGLVFDYEVLTKGLETRPIHYAWGNHLVKLIYTTGVSQSQSINT